MDNSKMQQVKKIGGIVLNIMVWIILVVSILTTILVFTAQGSADGIPSVFGRSLVTIETYSMEPTFKKGSLVFMTKLSDEQKTQLKKGDIITYRAPIDIDGDGKDQDINTHRIDVEPGEGALTVKTKGDNPKTNPIQDDYFVHHSDIIGKCSERAIPALGAIIGFLRSSLGFFLCIVLPLILFFLYELYRFISLIVTERAKKAPVSKETEEEIKQRAIEEYIRSQQQNSENNASNKEDN